VGGLTRIILAVGVALLPAGLRSRDRLLVVVSAYIAASTAAAAVAVIASRLFLIPGQSAPDGIAERISDFLCSLFFLAGVIGIIALLPAGLMIALAERRRIRNAWFYATAGALTALCPLALDLAIVLLGTLRGVKGGPFAGRSGGYQPLLLAILIGLVAGLTYWLIAGRSAGGHIKVKA
jgi:hypothetical protein